MGYDFEALETGELWYDYHSYDGSEKTQRVIINVTKGKKYSLDFGGVRIRER